MEKEEIKFSNWIIGLLVVGLIVTSLHARLAIGVRDEDGIKIFSTFQKNLSGLINETGYSYSSGKVTIATDENGNLQYLNQKITNGKLYTFQISKPYSFQDGSRIFKIASTAINKNEIAQKHGIHMGLYDKFETVQDSENPKKTIDKIIRVEHKITKETEPVPYNLLYQPNNRVEKGKIVIWEPGSGGEIEKTFKEIYEDGSIISKKLISTRTSKVAIHQVMAEGNAELPPAYEKMMIMESTAYTPTVEECDSDPTTCATGMKSGYGVVAVYPAEIPYYTELYIEGYGYAIAGDCGGAIGGGRIDVFFYDKASAFKWGRRKVRVYVLGRAEKP